MPPVTHYSCNFCHRHRFTSRRAVAIHQSKDPACKLALRQELELKRQQADEAEQQQYLDEIMRLPEIIDINHADSLDDMPNGPSISEPPRDAAASEPSLPAAPDYDIDALRPAPSVDLEEIEDEDNPREGQCYMEEFAAEKAARATYGESQTLFEKIRDETVLRWGEVLGPFKNDDEWQFAKWIIKHVGHNAADELLRLNMIQNGAKPSFTKKDEFLATIDQLPEGVAWKLQSMTLTGDRKDIDGKPLTEELELWWRDPVEVIKDLMGNPAFREVMKYAPERLFEDTEGQCRMINEMWTADWWWELQKALPFGATIVPIILSSDKTRLSQFRGDKSAWPVYLTIGNISKDVRREASSYATVLIGYLPVGKFDCYTEKARQFAWYRLFHHCMAIIMKSVAEVGAKGTMITCADGFVRHAWPILAAYVADYPEQCLIACCKENRCPICTVSPNQRGENCACAYRDPQLTLEMLKRKGQGESSTAFNKEWDELGLRPVFQPFWQNLPFSNIFQVFTPDLLHQLHKGVFKDHLAQWCTTIMGKNEMDERFKAMVDHPGMRHFKNGISGLSQTTGHEHKAMEQVFLGVIAGAVPDRVVKAVKAALDFIYFSSLHSHTSRTLDSLAKSLNDFHEHKSVFIELGVREHFNIPKIHSMQHYASLIRYFGTADGFNTESPERLHIDYAKDAYRASNRRDYTIQMTTWLRRQEAVDRFESFLSWCRNGAYQPTEKSEDDVAVVTDSSRVDLGSLVGTSSAQPANSTPVSALGYHIASTHPRALSAVPASKIIEGHRASRFLESLTTYLRAHGCRLTPQGFDVFDLFKRITLQLPAIPQASRKNLKNIVRATPPAPAQGRRSAQSAQLDFAYIRTGERNERTEGTPVEGLRIAHVRVIFRLPGLYNVHGTAPLAYVEWLTPFGRRDAVTGLYAISRSTRMGHVYGEIIEVDRIVRNCHVFPHYGRVKPLAWTVDSVTDLCTSFLVNPYRDLHSFCALEAVINRCI